MKRDIGGLLVPEDFVRAAELWETRPIYFMHNEEVSFTPAPRTLRWRILYALAVARDRIAMAWDVLRGRHDCDSVY